MKIAIFGTGGVGGYFGGLLAHAGYDVAFIARGDHLEALRKHGLDVKSVNGDFYLEQVVVTDDPAEIGSVDYLVVAVKHYQLQEAMGQMTPLIGEDTLIFPLLNGVDAHEILLASLSPASVVGGLCSLATAIKVPGVIHQMTQLRRIVAGALDRKPDPRLERLLAAWRDCGVETIHSQDIYIDIWTKFLFIASFGCVSSLARANAGEITGTPQTRSLLLKAMEEVEVLARAQGIQLASDVVERAIALLESMEPGTTSSMQRDVASGRPFELEAFSGKIVQLGRANGVPTPTYEVLDGLLRPALLRSLKRL